MLKALSAFTLAAAAAASSAQTTFQTAPPDLQAKVDSIARDVLAKTGVPSASVGVVVDGRIVLTSAYGDARLSPPEPATPAMQYPIGSISKQFTAACMLLLVEQGKVSLDDPISRWFPELTRASEVTVREILSHTSGYEDYAPQDYTIPLWTRPADPSAVVHDWAGKPLDFDPGTQWQYSNTNFVLAALIVQKASGEPYFQFLSEHVLTPLGLSHAINLDTDRKQVQPLGYMRNALGPLRPAQMEGPGWYFGDASLAMPASDLLTWDLSIINQSLLKPASYTAMETAVPLKNGTPTRYGLGVSVLTAMGHRLVEHSGEVGGFVAENMVFPDDKIAIAVLTNEEASSAASLIGRRIAQTLLAPATASSPPADAGRTLAETQAKAILTGLQHGRLDRAPLTSDLNFYFSPQAIADFQSSLGPLGPIQSLTQAADQLRGGMTFREFTVKFADPKNTTLSLTTYTMPDGKLEQFLIGP